MTAKKATTNKATAAKVDAPEETPVEEVAKGDVFYASRGFTDGKTERKFTAGSETPIGLKKADVSQTDAERFVEAGHGKIE